MKSEIFADGIVGIVVSGQVVRIDFASQAMPGEINSETLASANPSDKVPMLPRQRIVMPIDGFAQCFGVLEQVMTKLMADGAVKRNVTDSSAPPAPAGYSPNFPQRK